MRSKTSLFNKAIILNNLKRFSLFSLLYTYALFFAIPLGIILNGHNLADNPFNLESNLSIIIFFAFIVSIVLAVLIFRYMNVKKSADMFYSLPIKRIVLYRSNIFSGFILLFIPVLIIGLICLVMNFTLNLQNSYSIIDIIKWITVTTLINFTFFLICSTIGMLTGLSSMQAAVTCILLFSPILLMVLIIENSLMFINGLNLDSVNVFFAFDVFDVLQSIFNEIGMSLFLTILITLCIFLYFIGRILYGHRNSEIVSRPFQNKALNYIFKYFITFFSMLLIGLIFFYINSSSYIWIFAGYILGSLIGYFVSEIILTKSLHFFTNIKGYGFYIAAMLIIAIGMKFGITSYENRVPSLEDVNSIGFYEEIGRAYGLDVCTNYISYTYSDLKTMQSISDLHKELIKESPLLKYSNKLPLRMFLLQYHLKNGSTVARTYYAPIKSYSASLRTIYQSEEYIKKNYYVANLSPLNIKEIRIQSNVTTKKEVKITILRTFERP